jgi:hypothetical protein
MMLHALGSSHQAALGWRNRYCAPVNDPDIEALRGFGYVENIQLLNGGRDLLTRVTEKGIAFLRAKHHIVRLTD